MESAKQLPLEGIRVLELCHTVMGPACGMILADMGAEVYKVERTGRGDDTRYLKGFGSGFFTYFNRNKKSIALDLKSETGKTVLLTLIEAVDVLVENFGPGALDRLGLGYDVCKKRNPRLIYCSLKGFMPGPYESRPALDEVVQMMGGLAFMTGLPGRPMRVGASVTDILGGCFGAIGILAALHERERSGAGKFVQATLYESVAFLVGQHMAAAAVTGEPPPPMSAKLRTWSIYDLFTTADDEQVFIGITSDPQWNRFCETFQFTDWIGVDRLATNQKRVDESGWLIPELRRRLGALKKETLLALAETAGIPFAPVARPTDLFDDPHLNASGGLMAIETPGETPAKLPKIPLRLDGSGFDLRHQPPRIGEGARELLRSCGFTDARIAEFVNDGVLGITDPEERPEPPAKKGPVP